MNNDLISKENQKSSTAGTKRMPLLRSRYSAEQVLNRMTAEGELICHQRAVQDRNYTTVPAMIKP